MDKAAGLQRYLVPPGYVRASASSTASSDSVRACGAMLTITSSEVLLSVKTIGCRLFQALDGGGGKKGEIVAQAEPVN